MYRLIKDFFLKREGKYQIHLECPQCQKGFWAVFSVGTQAVKAAKTEEVVYQYSETACPRCGCPRVLIHGIQGFFR